jgi:hypothetical protein
MAPGDGPPNQVEIEANAPFHVDLTCEVSLIAPTLLQDSKATVSFSAIADPTTNEILESHAPIKLGIPGSAAEKEITLCVKVKTVKRRTIIVNVYPITSAATPTGILTSSPSPSISQQAMQDYFDRIFLEQINVKCQIALKPGVVVDWDKSTAADYNNPFAHPSIEPKVGDTYFDLPPNRNGHESGHFLSVDANGNSTFNGNILPANELHLFLMGGCSLIRTIEDIPPTIAPGGSAGGTADVENDRCFVATSTFKEEELGEMFEGVRQRILYTMAHEIGHLIITIGHPDQYNPASEVPGLPFSHNGGPAPLARDPALHQWRLMASGNVSKYGSELVLEEWNQILTKVDRLTNLPAQRED